MVSRRILLVTGRFWPQIGGAERVAMTLADEFVAAGHQVTVLSAHWQRRLPAEFDFRGVRVIRLPRPSGRIWGTFRYLANLRTYLREHHRDFDCICVSMLKHEAYAAVATLEGSNIPIFLRAEGAGPTGDVAWQKQARFGGTIGRRCRQAERIIVPSDAIASELIEADYSPALLSVIPNGVAPAEPPSTALMAEARRHLVHLNGSLAVPAGGKVVLYVGRLEEAKGLRPLIQAWRLIAPKFPTARLWLVGDGSIGSLLYKELLQDDMLEQVVLPGVFDEATEFYQAADVFVLPSWAEGLSISLLEAMSSGATVLATDVAGNRAAVTQDQHGILVQPQDANSLASALEDLLNNPGLCTRLAAAARNRFEEQFSARLMAARHLELFESAI